MSMELPYLELLFNLLLIKRLFKCAHPTPFLFSFHVRTMRIFNITFVDAHAVSGAILFHRLTLPHQE